LFFGQSRGTPAGHVVVVAPDVVAGAAVVLGAPVVVVRGAVVVVALAIVVFVGGSVVGGAVGVGFVAVGLVACGAVVAAVVAEVPDVVPPVVPDVPAGAVVSFEPWFVLPPYHGAAVVAEDEPAVRLVDEWGTGAPLPTAMVVPLPPPAPPGDRSAASMAAAAVLLGSTTVVEAPGRVGSAIGDGVLGVGTTILLSIVCTWVTTTVPAAPAAGDLGLSWWKPRTSTTPIAPRVTVATVSVTVPAAA
jgi:hypothetical protein